MAIRSLTLILMIFVATHCFAPAAALAQAEIKMDAPEAFDFPREWFYNGDKDDQWELMQLTVGKSVDTLEFTVRDWSGENLTEPPVSPIALRGRIVVLDFWDATSELSVESIKSHNTILDKYAGQGVDIIGICAESGSRKMPAAIINSNMNYVTARDTFRATAKAYGSLWHPWCVVIDRNGIIRAVGVKPEHLEKTIDAIIAEQPITRELASKTQRVQQTAQPDSDENGDTGNTDGKAVVRTKIPDEWFEASYNRLQNLQTILNKPAPELEVNDWRNGWEFRLNNRRGDVIVLMFWVADDPRCLQICRLVNKLLEEKEDEGLVVIGVCDRVKPDKLSTIIREQGIKFHLCVDPFRTTINKYLVDGYPDFYFIDRKGILRGADIKTKYVDKIVDMLLAEPK